MLKLAQISGADPRLEQYGSGGTGLAGRRREPSVEALGQVLPGRGVPPDVSKGLYKSARVPELLLNRSASIPIF